MSTKMINVFIDEKPSKVPLGYTIMQSCTQVGIDVPKFCYHDKLLIAGNCRICLVELMGSKKLLASCAVHISDNAYVYTNTARVRLARQNVLEFLLANHPLDCPICDQGGECDLQDITAVFGADRGRFYEASKRAVLNKDFGPLIRTSMNRCIHCTRCVRFLSFSAGMSVLGTLGRGASTEIGAYVNKFLYDELSGNITDLCPVGALTSKPYSFKARPWELVSTEALDIFDALNSNMTIDVAANKICRVLPYANELTNSGWLTNRARYAYDGLFFQRLNSCLIQVSALDFLTSKDRHLVSRFTKFFVKLSWTAALSIFLKKILDTRLKVLLVDLGASIDLETTAGAVEFVSLLGARVSSFNHSSCELSCDFVNLFMFNTSLLDLSRLPSFCFLLGTNPRLENPLVNLKLTKLQSDFSVPFYRIGASLSYYTYPVKFISNNLRSFLDICEFKHAFCKNFYTKTFLASPFFLIGAQVVASRSANVVMSALFTLLRHLNNFGKPDTGINYNMVYELSSFSVLGLYSGWLHARDLGIGVSATDLPEYSKSQILKTSSSNSSTGFALHYSIASDSNYALQAASVSNCMWSIYQGSHGSGVAAFADLVLPTSTYVERTVFYRNLLGMIQTSAPAVLYSSVPKTDVEIFKEIIAMAGTYLFEGFFRFNFKRAIRYNLDMDLSHVLLLPLSFRVVRGDFFRKLLPVLPTATTADIFALTYAAYYYNFSYWSYFSYSSKLNSLSATSYLDFFLSANLRSSGKRVFFTPLQSALVNYYADASLPVLTASKTMNMSSSLYLKRNLSVLQLHL